LTHLEQLETVLFSLYYPSEKGVNSSKQHHFWLPRPIDLIAQGLAVSASGVDPKLILLGFNIIAGDLVIPAQVDLPLFKGSNQYPVVFFSHGDTSLATWYSQYSGEMASRGYIVVTIQHRDGSSAATQVMIKGQPTRNVTAFAVEQLA
jgi:platelet-activating factor acetylhydrolase